MCNEKKKSADLFEGKPAAGRVGGVGWVFQALQGRLDGVAVGCLEPGFMWRLCWSGGDAAHVIQSEHHGPHQSRVLLSHDGDLFIPAEQQNVRPGRRSPAGMVQQLKDREGDKRRLSAGFYNSNLKLFEDCYEGNLRLLYSGLQKHSYSQTFSYFVTLSRKHIAG